MVSANTQFAFATVCFFLCLSFFFRSLRHAHRTNRTRGPIGTNHTAGPFITNWRILFWLVLTAKLLIKFENIQDMQNCRPCGPPPSTCRLWWGSACSRRRRGENFFVYACLCIQVRLVLTVSPFKFKQVGLSAVADKPVMRCITANVLQTKVDAQLDATELSWQRLRRSMFSSYSEWLIESRQFLFTPPAFGVVVGGDPVWVLPRSSASGN